MILLSANAFNIDKSIILSLGKGLCLTCQFLALPIQQQKKIYQQYGQMGLQLSDLEENIVRKEDIAHYEQFLLFPQCFQKLSC